MAETTRLIFQSLLERYPENYELYQVGLSHRAGGPKVSWPIYPTKALSNENGKTVYSKSDLHGEETVRSLLLQLMPDLIFAFNDPQNLEFLCVDEVYRKCKLILYANFDGFPVPPDYKCLFKADHIVVMAEFAKRAFLASHQNCDSNKVSFIYAPADVRRFHPVSEQKKLEFRQTLFPSTIPINGFVFGWVGINQWRKQVWLLYQVIQLLRTGNYLLCLDCNRVSLIRTREFMRIPILSIPIGLELNDEAACHRCGSLNTKRAEPLTDIFLWLHMPHRDQHSIWPAGLLEKLFGADPGNGIHYSEKCSPRDFLDPGSMPTLFQAWDALLYLSGGEGFGVPAWEAMCSGLPVIYSNYSSHAEFLNQAKGGLAVGGTLQPEPMTCVLRLIADVAETLEAARRLYYGKNLAKSLGANGRAFAEKFQTGTIAAQWHEIFQQFCGKEAV